MGRVLTALLIVVAFVGSALAQSLSQREIAERLVAAFRAAVPTATVRIDHEGNVEVHNGDVTSTVGVARVARELEGKNIDAGIRAAVERTLKGAQAARAAARDIVAQRGTLTRRAFAEKMAAAFKAADPKAVVSILNETELDHRTPDGRRRILALDNAYRLYAQDPKRLDDVIQTYVAGTRERIKNPQQQSTSARLDRTRIVPVVKDRQWLEDNYRSFRERGVKDEFLVEELNKELVIVYAEDSDNRTRYLMTSEDVGDRKELRKLAMQNLMRLLPKARMENIGDVTIITAGGDYEASLLLLDHFWTGGKINGQIEVKGDIVVAIPAKNVLLVTGSQSRKGLKVVREIAAKEVQGPHRITDTLFVYRDGRFRKFGRTKASKE
jgi:uncharacterized protein YtpQ (UPF0354 family)